MSEESSLAQASQVYKVVLTGGPCGGKTTCQSVITDRLQDLGWRVFRVPEAATLIFTGGFSFVGLDDQQVFEFQTNLLKAMLALEDTFYNLAISCGQKSVVLCDRGVMDTSAYMSKAAFRRMLDQVGLSDIAAKEGRYHGVIHLVTAADGAEKFYGSETNATRRENPEEAREIDQKIRAAWIGHPYLSVIDNSTSFSDKVKKVLDCVLHLVGEPTPGIAKRKFLVSFAPEELPVDFQTYDVEHDYLISTDATQQRLRRRGKNGRYTFTLTTRYSKSEDGQRVETRRVLTEKEHESLVNSQKDPERMTVKKQRRSFLYERQYFELDLYLQPKTGLLLLEGSMDPTLEPNLPPFLQVEREVTKSPEFSMFALAKLD